MSSSATTTTTTTTTTQTQTTTQQMSKGSAHSPSTNSAASACLRLQSDLRSIRIEPPEVKDGREKHRSALFFPDENDNEAPVFVISPKREKKKSVFISSRAITHTHIVLLLTRARCSHVVDVAYFYHRDVRHRRTRTITCSCGRRRFADRKIRPGKVASSLFG